MQIPFDLGNKFSKTFSSSHKKIENPRSLTVKERNKEVEKEKREKKNSNH